MIQIVNLCQVASGRTKTSDTGEKSAATPPGTKVDNADHLYHLSPFQLDVKKKKDDEDDLRKSPALTTLLTELSTVHSPKIEVLAKQMINLLHIVIVITCCSPGLEPSQKCNQEQSSPTNPDPILKQVL